MSPDLSSDVALAIVSVAQLDERAIRSSGSGEERTALALDLGRLLGDLCATTEWGQAELGSFIGCRDSDPESLLAFDSTVLQRSLTVVEFLGRQVHEALQANEDRDASRVAREALYLTLELLTRVRGDVGSARLALLWLAPEEAPSALLAQDRLGSARSAILRAVRDFQAHHVEPLDPADARAVAEAVRRAVEEAVLTDSEDPSSD